MGFFICAEGISQAEMLVFLFGAARESEKLAKRVSHDFMKKIKIDIFSKLKWTTLYDYDILYKKSMVIMHKNIEIKHKRLWFMKGLHGATPLCQHKIKKSCPALC